MVAKEWSDTERVYNVYMIVKNDYHFVNREIFIHQYKEYIIEPQRNKIVERKKLNTFSKSTQRLA
jgi:hypothetical protein